MKHTETFVNNGLFSAKLTYNVRLVYIYLCKCSNAKNECFPSHKSIGAACSISISTVKKALSELENSKMIVVQGQKRENKGTKSNLYIVNNDKTGGFFKAPGFIFTADLSSKSKLVYFYFCRLSGGSSTVYPAHKTTAEACGLSVAGVRLAIDELEENELIERAPQYRQDKGQRANLYTLMTPCQATPTNPDPNKEAEQEATQPIAQSTEQPTISTPPSQNKATTLAKSRLPELINIRTKVNNDSKGLNFKEKEFKEHYRDMAYCSAGASLAKLANHGTNFNAQHGNIAIMAYP